MEKLKISIAPLQLVGHCESEKSIKLRDPYMR